MVNSHEGEIDLNQLLIQPLHINMNLETSDVNLLF